MVSLMEGMCGIEDYTKTVWSSHVLGLENPRTTSRASEKVAYPNPRSKTV